MSDTAAALLKVGMTLGAFGLIFGVMSMLVLAVVKGKDEHQ